MRTLTLQFALKVIVVFRSVVRRMGEVRFFSMRALKADSRPAGHSYRFALALAACHSRQQRPSVEELLQQFESASVFTQQFVVAHAIVAANDRSVLGRLGPWLTHRDRCLRGNAAYIFGRLGDRRGFDVIVAIFGDRSTEREAHVVSSIGLPSIQGQIRQDRYYAAHLLGDLKDPSEPRCIRRAQLPEQRLSVLQVGGIEAFGEPVVDFVERRARLIAAVGVAPYKSCLFASG